MMQLQSWGKIFALDSNPCHFNFNLQAKEPCSILLLLTLPSFAFAFKDCTWKRCRTQRAFWWKLWKDLVLILRCFRVRGFKVVYFNLCKVNFFAKSHMDIDMDAIVFLVIFPSAFEPKFLFLPRASTSNFVKLSLWQFENHFMANLFQNLWNCIGQHIL